MNKLLTAIILSIALSAAAHAQAAPTAKHEMECCEKMKAEGKECCCKDMASERKDGMAQNPKPKADQAPAHDSHEHTH